MRMKYFTNAISAAGFAVALVFCVLVASSITSFAQRNRSWDSYPNWGGSYELRQTALNAGYNEGIKQGHNDRQKNRRFDFRSQGAYQKATTDYSSRLGDRELYRRYYREGYENGYTDSYRGY